MGTLDHLKKVLPQFDIGRLKDMASQVMTESARLEGSMAVETATTLGDQLRLLNSYHSNLIEGHKTGILDIRKALEGEYSADVEKRYAQELCAAHVVTEREALAQVVAGNADPFALDFLLNLHERFYSQLPPEHQFTHEAGGFADVPVRAGVLRDCFVIVDGNKQLGPAPEDVPEYLEAVLPLYSSMNHHGDEKLLAVLSLHHRLAWIHPFRDGNGRMVRLQTAAAMAQIGINRSGLWSLSRGLSRNKDEYYVNLRFVDEFDAPRADENLSDFIMLCLEQCLDQIQFVSGLLDLNKMEARIESYLVNDLLLRARILGDKDLASAFDRPSLPSVLHEAFRNGTISRPRIFDLLGVKRKRGTEIIYHLVAQGLLVRGATQKSPFKFGFPEDAMPTYFPYLYKPSIMRDVEDNRVVYTAPVHGTLLRSGDRAMVARADGTVSEIGPWRPSYAPHLAKRVRAFSYEGEMKIVED